MVLAGEMESIDDDRRFKRKQDNYVLECTDLINNVFLLFLYAYRNHMYVIQGSKAMTSLLGSSHDTTGMMTNNEPERAALRIHKLPVAEIK